MGYFKNLLITLMESDPDDLELLVAEEAPEQERGTTYESTHNVQCTGYDVHHGQDIHRTAEVCAGRFQFGVYVPKMWEPRQPEFLPVQGKCNPLPALHHL